MKIGELFFQIGGKTEGLTQGLQNAKKQVAIFAAEITATLYIIDRFVEASTKGAYSISTMSKAAGVAAQDLQKFGIAASLSNAGIAAEEASAQVAAFSKNLFELQRFGQGNAGGFNALAFMGKGIAFGGKTSLQVLGELRENLKGLTDQEAVNLIEKFGFSAQFLEVFRLSNAEFTKLGNSLVRSPEQIESMKRTGAIINQLKMDFSKLKDVMVVELEPAWRGIVQLIRSGGSAIGELKSAFNELPEAIGYAAAALGAVLLAALAPVMATLAAVFLVIDDYMAYKSGGKSVIGGVLGMIPSRQDVESMKESIGIKSSPRSIGSGDSALDLFGDSGSAPNTFTEHLSKNANITNNIQIHGAGDPHVAAGVIADKMQQQLNHSYNDQNTGGAY